MYAQELAATVQIINERFAVQLFSLRLVPYKMEDDNEEGPKWRRYYRLKNISTKFPLETMPSLKFIPLYEN